MNLTTHDVIVKRDDQMEASIGSETLVMRVDSGYYYSVDETGQAIWAAIEGPTPVNAIVEALLDQYDVEQETCETETLTFLNDLLAQNLINRLKVSQT